MEITREYFEQTLDKKLKEAVAPLATKQEVAAIERTLNTKLDATEQRIIKRIDDAVEELARITNTGFEDVLEPLDVRERVFRLESDVHAIKETLHLSA